MGLTVVASDYSERFAYNASSLVEYQGWALPNSTATAALWKIVKYTYSGNTVISKQFADGNAKFDNVWDDHATLSYS